MGPAEALLNQARSCGGVTRPLFGAWSCSGFASICPSESDPRLRLCVGVGSWFSQSDVM